MTVDPDLAEFEAMNLRKGPLCGIAVALDALGDDAGKLSAALAAPHIRSTTIYRWLVDHGVKVRPDTVNRHRRGECACADS